MVEMFQPQLRVEGGGDVDLVLHAATPTPNSCYGAGEPSIQSEPPRGKIGVPEARYAILPLTYNDGSGGCLQYVNTVHHRLPVPYLPGQNMIHAVVTLDGKIQGSSVIQLPDPDNASKPQEPIDVKEVTAWIDAQPPEKPTLYVEAMVMVPNPSYVVDLIAADEPQGDGEFNLQLKIDQRDGLFPSVVKTRSVEFEQDGAQPETVIIHLPGGSEITTGVRHTV